jgi:hypothetical protein
MADRFNRVAERTEASIERSPPWQAAVTAARTNTAAGSGTRLECWAVAMKAPVPVEAAAVAVMVEAGVGKELHLARRWAADAPATQGAVPGRDGARRA